MSKGSLPTLSKWVTIRSVSVHTLAYCKSQRLDSACHEGKMGSLYILQCRVIILSASGSKEARTFIFGIKMLQKSCFIPSISSTNSHSIINGVNCLLGQKIIIRKTSSYLFFFFLMSFTVILKDRMISVHFQGKPFNVTVIQVYAPNSNAKEAEVEWF